MSKSKLPNIYWEDGYTPFAGLDKGFGWLIDRRIPDIAVGCFSQDFKCYKDNKVHVQCYVGLNDHEVEKENIEAVFDSFEDAREFICRYWEENGESIIVSDKKVRSV